MWYLTTLAFEGMWPSKYLYLRQSHCLMRADEANAAYQNAGLLGIELLAKWSKSQTSLSRFVGVEDLLLVSDKPADGSEILWAESEMSESALAKELNVDARFRSTTCSSSGWFVARILLYEVILNDQNDRHLVWKNWHVIEASDFDPAYKKALDIGNAYRGKAGEHTSDSKPAVWKFGAVQRLQPTISPPGDRSVLWYDDLPARESTFGRISSMKKEDMSLFQWRSLHRRRPVAL